MKLKLNEAYKIGDNRIIIPRSHFKENYAIFQDTITTDRGYVTRYAIFGIRQLKRFFGLEKGDKVEII